MIFFTKALSELSSEPRQDEKFPHVCFLGWVCDPSHMASRCFLGYKPRWLSVRSAPDLPLASALVLGGFTRTRSDSQPWNPVLGVWWR